MAKVRIGIIGAGIVGERLIKAIGRHGGGEVMGVYDTNAERLQQMSEEYNLTAVDSYWELLENPDIELIYLAVPPKYHHFIAMEIIGAKKHLLCEKPLANSNQEAMEMYEAAAEAGIIHAMNFPTVYSASFKRLEELLKEGFIGDLRRIELHGYFKQWPRAWQQTEWIASKEQGGFIREVFTHFVQIILSCFGRITDISTFIEAADNPAASETGIIAAGRLKSGATILFNGFSNIGIEDKLALGIYGTKGMLSLENWRELWISDLEGRRRIEVQENDHLAELLEEVFAAIEGREAKLVTFKEGMAVQRVIEGLLGRDE